MIHRAFRFRLAPTSEQEQTLGQWAGVCRLVHNLALEQRRDWWRQHKAATGLSLNYVTQGHDLTVLRAEYDWIAAVQCAPLTQVLRDLDRAFAAFFAGRARFPAMKRRGQRDSFRMKASEVQIRPINGRWAAVRIGKLGWVRFRNTREFSGKMLNATISRDALGWHVSFASAIEHEAPANDSPSVGVDRGVAVTLALSNGEQFNIPQKLGDLARRQSRARRALSRCARGSRRRLRRLKRVARLSARIARVRGDWQHRVSRTIADRFGTVVMEDLKIPNMTAAGKGKRGLNRSILNQGWGGFATKLAYKLEERGGALVKINPAYTSQTCSDCGAVDAGSRKNQASFVCTSCGFATNADTNAAIIILRRSTALMPAEGSGYAPDEPGTCLRAA